MPYASPEAKREHGKRYYARRRQYFIDKCRRHREENPRLHAYWGQCHTSRQRGIPFLMTFEEWDQWWGDDFEMRGRGPFALCMCRYGDKGAYEIGNIYKATNSDNKLGPREKDEGLHEDIPF